MRLNKAIAACGYCSRRKADEAILGGRVRINGNLQLEPGVQVNEDDEIEVDGKILPKPEKNIYLMLNKPVHTICTAHDPDGRKTIFDLLPEEYRDYRLFSVGRLDYFSEGLLILTNDGALAQRLSHPRYEERKIYEVLIRGEVSEEDLAKIRTGFQLNDNIKLKPIKVTTTPFPHGDTLLTMELTQGINRQIRKICDSLGLTILKLRRTYQAGLKLGNLPSGHFRPLSPKEISLIKTD